MAFVLAGMLRVVVLVQKEPPPAAWQAATLPWMAVE